MLLINCPNCKQFIIMEAINCGIARCGIFKNSYEQIPPHLEREKCLELVRERLIYGCGQPFKIVENKAEKCDWI